MYLDAARESKLTIEILEALINSLDQLSNDDPSKAVNLKITASQFSDLIHSIFDYTIRLAEANNISTALISKPKILKKKLLGFTILFKYEKKYFRASSIKLSIEKRHYRLQKLVMPFIVLR